MPTFLFYLFTILGAYLFGSIPWGYLIGRLYGKDIRKLGSGNIGATNVTRSIGKLPGRLCFALDALKGFLPVLAVSQLLRHQLCSDPWGWIQIAALAGSVGGHMFSCFLHFKGGKGISTAAGAVLALSPYAVLIAAAVWLIAFLAWRYVSLASIAAAAALPLSATIIDAYHLYPHSNVTLGGFYLLSLAAILKHLSNLKRLLNGTENRFQKKSKTPEK